MINYDLTKIKALFFDVDGVLSAETITIDDNGVPMRTANIKDGYVMQLAVKRGMILGIITGGKCQSVAKRYEGLGIKEIHLGCSIKIEKLKELMLKYNLKEEEILYMGDDIPDYEVMQMCGLPCCPNDASPEIKEISIYISTEKGGMGCVRDVIEQVLKAKNMWNMDKTAFGW